MTLAAQEGHMEVVRLLMDWETTPLAPPESLAPKEIEKPTRPASVLASKSPTVIDVGERAVREGEATAEVKERPRLEEQEQKAAGPTLMSLSSQSTLVAKKKRNVTGVLRKIKKWVAS